MKQKLTFHFADWRHADSSRVLVQRLFRYEPLGLAEVVDGMSVSKAAANRCTLAESDTEKTSPLPDVRFGDARLHELLLKKRGRLVLISQRNPRIAEGYGGKRDLSDRDMPLCRVDN